jgi:hypothetical protein
MKYYGLCFAILIAGSPLYAQIYKWTDSKGDVHFSDTPQPGAEEITMPKVQTYSPPIRAEKQVDADASDDSDPKEYDKVSIVQPEDQTTIRNTEGFVSIVTDLSPKLRRGDKLQLVFDGSPLGEPQSNNIIGLKGINRGSHTFAVQVLSARGKVLSTSKTITLYMMPPRVGMGKGAP